MPLYIPIIDRRTLDVSRLERLFHARRLKPGGVR